MSMGMKEVGGDLFGGSGVFGFVTDPFGSFARVGRKKRRKKTARSTRISSKRKRSHRKRSHRKKHSKSIRRTKRKGMSKAFLRALRKKHGLGEFKK